MLLLVQQFHQNNHYHHHVRFDVLLAESFTVPPALTAPVSIDSVSNKSKRQIEHPHYWNTRFEEFKVYFDANGPFKYKENPQLPDEQRWNKRFQELMLYYHTNGHSDVPRKYKENPQLGTLVMPQRANAYQMLVTLKQLEIRNSSFGHDNVISTTAHNNSNEKMKDLSCPLMQKRYEKLCSAGFWFNKSSIINLKDEKDGTSDLKN